MNKQADLYSECVDVLEAVQSTILEILESGHGLDKDKWYIVKMAFDIVRDFESLAPEVKEAMIELDDRIKAGEMTLEDALNMVTNPVEIKLDNKKRLLLN